MKSRTKPYTLVNTRQGIRFALPSSCAGAKISLVDISGKLIRSLQVSKNADALWDLRDNKGWSVAKGSYLAIVQGTGGRQVIPVVFTGN